MLRISCFYPIPSLAEFARKKAEGGGGGGDAIAMRQRQAEEAKARKMKALEEHAAKKRDAKPDAREEYIRQKHAEADKEKAQKIAKMKEMGAVMSTVYGAGDASSSSCISAAASASLHAQYHLLCRVVSLQRKKSPCVTNIINIFSKPTPAYFSSCPPSNEFNSTFQAPSLLKLPSLTMSCIFHLTHSTWVS